MICFIWRIKKRGIPTKAGLIRRGINIPSSICELCGNGLEDGDHLLVGCDFAKKVW